MTEIYPIAKSLFERVLRCAYTFDDSAEEITVSYPSCLDDGAVYPVTLSFLEDGDDCSVRIKINYMSLPEPDRSRKEDGEAMLALKLAYTCNEVNRSFRWGTLVYEDGEMIVYHDEIVTEDAAEQELLESFAELINYCDTHYDFIQEVVRNACKL